MITVVRKRDLSDPYDCDAYDAANDSAGDHDYNCKSRIRRQCFQPRIPCFMASLFFSLSISILLSLFFPSSQEKRKEIEKKTAASFMMDSTALTMLKPLRKPGNYRAAMIEMTQAACIVTEVPKVDQGDARNQFSLAVGMYKCLQRVCSKCVTCLNTLPFFKPLRKCMRAIAESALFDAVIVGIILMNTVVLALYHYGISKSFEKILDLSNMVSEKFYLKPQI